MTTRTVAVVWERGPVEGAVEVCHGELVSARVADGQGQARGNSFAVSSPGPCRLRLEISAAGVEPGGRAARVTIRARTHPFSFFLRDVDADYPIFLPAFGAAVTAGDDGRSYAQISGAVRARGLQSELGRLESEPEESYERAAARTRDLRGPTWLGLGRDMRIFEFDARGVEGYWGAVQPRFHGAEVVIPESLAGRPLRYHFVLGRGAGCAVDWSRRLDGGCLPILHGETRDGDILYRFTAFVTQERAALAAGAVRGTHFLVADGHAAGHMFTAAQQAEFERLRAEELGRDQETVFRLRATATNAARVPRYAHFRAPAPDRDATGAHVHEPGTGFGVFESGRVFSLARLDGRPMAEPEAAVLVRPGECAAFEFALPHRPLPRGRAEQLAGSDFDARLAECRAFWQAKLARGARLELPERRVDEMVRAGLLHLDLITYGLEPDGTLAPTIGRYAPIGTESVPIVLGFECLGWHDVARRSIQYFLDKQHEDGFIQNFGGYTAETGGALYLIGEHWRFTRDREWLRAVAPRALAACRYVLDWRRRNLREELRGRGRGLLDGKVADPEDPFHYFMNSGYAYLGLKRTAEWLAELDPPEAGRLAAEAEAFRRDIRAELAECLARSPVVPLGDGSWCPTAPPWAEATGALSLLCEGESCFTHHTFTGRDSLIGPLWLVFQEVLEPDGPEAGALLASHAALHTLHNVGFSQPYYCRHDWAHLRRGEVRAFLKTYYNGFAGLADRETYSWWEHYFHASPHKTHEEAWFLMQTRWMLLMEEDEDLRLLRAVPRAWLAGGRRIVLERMASYFGPVSLRVESRPDEGVIAARYLLAGERRPRRLLLRLPHPDGLRAREVRGGVYDRAAESVVVAEPGAEGEILLRF